MRQDIPVAQQIVQSNHATFEMASRLPASQETTPSVVVIGVPDQPALLRVIAKLEANGIAHQAFHEPDFGMGLSAVATVPLGQERQILGNYRIWKESNNTAKDMYEKQYS